MNTTAVTTNSEAVRKINRHMLKFVAVRIIVPAVVASTVILISNRLEKKMDAIEASEESTD